MKKFFTATLLTAAFAVTPVLAAGHATLRSNIPFDFTVGKKILPAGEYTVADSFGSDMMYIRSVDGKQAAMAITNAGSPNANGNEATLAFSVVDGKRYLVSVTRPGVAKDLPRAPQGNGVLTLIKAAIR